jgi:hypothetical protein
MDVPLIVVLAVAVFLGFQAVAWFLLAVRFVRWVFRTGAVSE